MDFELDEDQRALVQLVDDVFTREAGPERARAVLEGSGFDADLLATLENSGLLDLFADADAGPLAAELVVEAAAARLATVDLGARTLVAAGLRLEGVVGPIALADRTVDRIRFGGQAKTVLLLDGEDARVATVVSVEDDLRDFGYPVAKVTLVPGDRVGRAEDLRSWWRVALAAEVAGTASSALDLTVRYLSEREAFGRPIGSRQAIQHRLATIYYGIEGVRWQARYASFHQAEPLAAASAATAATILAKEAIWELHQLTGAIGFTNEYDLQLYTLRLHTLRLELDGIEGGHAAELAERRWFSPEGMDA